MTLEQKLVSYSNISKLEEIIKKFGEAKVLVGLTWSSMMIEEKMVTKYSTPLLKALSALIDVNALYKEFDRDSKIRKELTGVAKYLERISKSFLYNALLKLPWIGNRVNKHFIERVRKDLLSIYNKLEEEEGKLKQDLINMYPNKRSEIEEMFRKIETSEYILQKTKYFKQLTENYS